MSAARAELSRYFKVLARAAFVAFLLLPVAGPVRAGDDRPVRVVSINLCTDEMAMLLAAPGQLVSVSFLAADPKVSALSDVASGYRLNHGLAEEVFLMKPDLVLAGSYTTRDTVNLLKRLGVPVAEFAPESSLDDVRANLRRMGQLLGREQAADKMVTSINTALSRIDAEPVTQMTAAFYFENGYTAGENTLTSEIAAHAGLKNVSATTGLDGLGRLPLEKLIMLSPQVIVTGDDSYSAPALAEKVFVHPAFAALAKKSQVVDLPGRDTICGGPFNITAMEKLRNEVDRSTADE
ncbi:ABC transporter substrate-binding protein [Martelella sp. HB161492]|uniref:ABC transporter substrate-binding protein n=1 Tax=Martelella sp. HB161492 TaxID=2720726 RepID=UPI001FEE2739|nr:ABC transporter substrate-binding protein [Martelella sp. HB161492]